MKLQFLTLAALLMASGLSTAYAGTTKYVCVINAETPNQKDTFSKLLLNDEVFKDGSDSEIIAILPTGGVFHISTKDWANSVQPKSILKDARVVTLQLSAQDQYPNKKSLTIFSGKNDGSEERALVPTAAAMGFVHENPSITASSDGVLLFDFVQKIEVFCSQKK